MLSIGLTTCAKGAWLYERIAGWVCTWGELLAFQDEPSISLGLRKHERTGRALGDRPFLQRVGLLLGRNLLPGKAGRPPRKGH